MGTLAFVFSSGWASGLNCYLVVLVLGIADRVHDTDQVPNVLAALGRARRRGVPLRHGVRRRQDPVRRLHLGRRLHRDPPDRRRRGRRPDRRSGRLAQRRRRRPSSAAAPPCSHTSVKAGRPARHQLLPRAGHQHRAPASPRTSPCSASCGSRSSTREPPRRSPPCCCWAGLVSCSYDDWRQAGASSAGGAGRAATGRPDAGLTLGCAHGPGGGDRRRLRRPRLRAAAGQARPRRRPSSRSRRARRRPRPGHRRTASRGTPVHPHPAARRRARPVPQDRAAAGAASSSCVQLDCLREHWFDDGTVARPSRRLARAPSSRPSTSLGAGLGAALARPRRRRTPTTGRCSAAATSRCRGTPDRSAARARRPAGLPRVPAQAAAARLRDERLRLVAAHPFVADGHDLRDVPAWAGLTAYLEQRFGAWAVRRAAWSRCSTRWSAGSTPAGRRRPRHAPATSSSVSGRAVAVTTTAGELDADVVVCAVDPRRLPALARVGRGVRRRRSRRPSDHLGLAGDVRDLPHELVVHGDPTLVLRTRRPGTRRATMPGRCRPWPARRGPRSPRWRGTGSTSASRSSTRVDRSRATWSSDWGGSPLGVLWQGRGTVRRRLGPRDAGRRACTPPARTRPPAPGCRTSGCPPRWSPRWSGPAALSLSRAGRSPSPTRSPPSRPARARRRPPSALADAASADAVDPALDDLLRVTELRAGEPGQVGARARPRRRTPPRGPPSRPPARVGHLQRDALDLQPVADRLGQRGQQGPGGVDVVAAERQRVPRLEAGGSPCVVVRRPDLDAVDADPLRRRVLAGRRRRSASAALSAPASASATPAARWTAATRTTAESGTTRASPWPVTVTVRMTSSCRTGGRAPSDRELQRGEDLARRLGPVERVEVQARGARRRAAPRTARWRSRCPRRAARPGRPRAARSGSSTSSGTSAPGQLGHPRAPSRGSGSA